MTGGGFGSSRPHLHKQPGLPLGFSIWARWRSCKTVSSQTLLSKLSVFHQLVSLLLAFKFICMQKTQTHTQKENWRSLFIAPISLDSGPLFCLLSLFQALPSEVCSTDIPHLLLISPFSSHRKLRIWSSTALCFETELIVLLICAFLGISQKNIQTLPFCCLCNRTMENVDQPNCKLISTSLPINFVSSIFVHAGVLKTYYIGMKMGRQMGFCWSFNVCG